MVKTLIYLPEQDYKTLELLAQKTKQAKAQLIRKYIADGLKKEKKKANAGAALLELAKLGKKLNLQSDDPHLSTNIDKYLYEEA